MRRSYPGCLGFIVNVSSLYQTALKVIILNNNRAHCVSSQWLFSTGDYIGLYVSKDFIGLAHRYGPNKSSENVVNVDCHNQCHCDLWVMVTASLVQNVCILFCVAFVEASLARMDAGNSSFNVTVGHAWTMAPMTILATSTVINVISMLVNVPHIFIIYAMPREKYVGARNDRLMLLHIAVLDLINTAIRLPLDNEFVQIVLHKNLWFCGLTAILGHAPQLVVELILVIAMADRLIAVLHPASYSRWLLPKHITWFFLIPYVYYIGAFVAFSIVYGEQLLIPRGFTMCFYNARVVKPIAQLLIVGVLVPLGVIIILYTVLLIAVCRNRTTSRQGEAGYAVKASKFIIAVVTIHFLLWVCAPISVLVMHTIGKPDRALWFLVPLLVALNSATHPPVYGMMYRR